MKSKGMDDLHVAKGTTTAGIHGYSKKEYLQEEKQGKRKEKWCTLFEQHKQPITANHSFEQIVFPFTPFACPFIVIQMPTTIRQITL